MTESLMLLLVSIFRSLQNKGFTGYSILKSSVTLKIFSDLYEKLSKVDVPPITSITEEEKNKYWNIAKEFYTEKEIRIKASKAAYLLNLLTENK